MLATSCRRLAFGRSVPSLSLNDGLLRSYPVASSTLALVANSRRLLAPLVASHQLRYGSSSSSPKNSNNSNGTAASSARSQPLRKKRSKVGSQEDGATATVTGTTGKSSKAGSKARSSDVEDVEGGGKSTRLKRSLLNALPSVPNTTYLTTKDVALSAFFALHRPVSVTYPVPALYDSAKFSKIFEEADATKQYKIQKDTQKSQRRAVFDIEGETEAQPYPEHAASRVASTSSTGVSAGEQVEVIEEDGGSHDSASIQIPNDLFVTETYVPFQPPPVPVPTNAKATAGQQLDEQKPQDEFFLRDGSSLSSAVGPLQSQTMKTLQIVLDNVEQMAQLFFPSETVEAGEASNRVQKRYITLVQSTLPDGSIHLTPVVPDGFSQRFLQRMKGRRLAYLERRNLLRHEIMHALSTKRRRKLKMKKHKLKKLRKRLRTEQRKLNRL